MGAQDTGPSPSSKLSEVDFLVDENRLLDHRILPFLNSKDVFPRRDIFETKRAFGDFLGDLEVAMN